MKNTGLGLGTEMRAPKRKNEIAKIKSKKVTKLCLIENSKIVEIDMGILSFSTLIFTKRNSQLPFINLIISLFIFY